MLVKNSTVASLTATGAEAVRVFGSTVGGLARIENTSKNVALAGNELNGGLTLTGNTRVTANERYTGLAGAYGPVVAGKTIRGALSCAANSADVKDFGAPNTLGSSYSGCALASSMVPTPPRAALSRPRSRWSSAPRPTSARSCRTWPGVHRRHHGDDRPHGW